MISAGRKVQRMAALQPVARPDSTDAQLLALKVPPHSIEAEQALLGALLMDNQAFDKIGDLLTGEDFYRDDHRRIWRHIVKMVENNQPADVVTVADSIERSEDKDKTGGPAYLAALSQNTPSAINIRRYAQLVRDRSVQRRARRGRKWLAGGDLQHGNELEPAGDAHAGLDRSRRPAQDAHRAHFGQGVERSDRGDGQAPRHADLHRRDGGADGA